jgi:hypothetical protein
VVVVGVGVVMTYIEQNVHTGEKRSHTEASLRARLLAVGASNMPAVGLPKLPAENTHSWFRKLRDNEIIPSRDAMSTGAWGLDTKETNCTTCNGAGTLTYKTADTSEQGLCWNCNGRKTVLVLV